MHSVDAEGDVMVTCLFECKMTLLQENTHRTCLTLCVVSRYLNFSDDVPGKQFSSDTTVNMVYAVNLK